MRPCLPERLRYWALKILYPERPGDFAQWLAHPASRGSDEEQALEVTTP